MKKSILIFLSILIVLTCASCNSSNNVKKSSVSNKNVSSTKRQNNKKQVEENENKQQEEKKAELDKKAQDGYDLFFQKKYTEAIAIEDEIIKENPEFFKAYYIKGISLCYAGDYDNGSKNIDKALSINPDDYTANFNKALSLELYRYFDEAIEWYEKAIKINGNGTWSYYGISSIYGRRGDVVNTVKFLKQAIALDSGVKEAAKEEQDFDPVKDSKEFKDAVN